MKPVVTILLPFRNATGTLDAAIASIVAQTFTDWALLLIDNASEDGGPAIAHAWYERDPRIHLITEPQVGIAHALNSGLHHATTPLIARMDADDVCHPERLAHQVTYLHEHPEVGVLGTRTVFATTVEKSSGMAWYVDWQNAILTPHEHYVKRFVDAPLAHPTVMFRRELIEQHGGYSTEPLPEDHELWLRWMDAGVRFAKLPKELLTWHDHPHRLSRTHEHYSIDAFFRTKAKWIARWLARTLNGRPVIVAGTSGLCQARVALLEAEGVIVSAYTDVRKREVPGYAFIPHEALPPAGEAFIVSFISQRGTGDRIAEFLSSRGLVEGVDFILAA
ncbi:MAG: glycosyltransferase [Flavobacteriales bacterium]|nr:glycosyltransferase [Flavobacteriales bacterium]MBK9287389.1 glycosyltransferase [Flavobacteriales bacterium]MBL0036203.1 glycosyltransferase [Flavobacteriales bacterium]